MTIVGFQVVQLRADPDDGYEVAPSVAFFDDQGTDAREALADAGPYTHGPVTVSGFGSDEGPFVAAFPAEGGDPLLELDEKGSPLRAADSALRALAVANDLMDDSETDPTAIDAAIREIWGLLSPDDEGLRELLFERLHHWAGSQGLLKSSPSLYWLLPWRDFVIHLRQLAFLVRHTERSDMPPDDEPMQRVPEIGHSFKYLIPGLAPSLREITEWRTPNSPITNFAVRAFTRRLRLLTLEEVPPDMREPLCKSVEDVGRRFQRRLESDWLRSVDHILAAQVTIDLYEMLLGWQAPFEEDVDAGRLKWMGRLALAAYEGHFDAGKVRLRQGTVDQLREMADRLEAQGLWFEDRARDSHRWWDRIFDAGFILYFSASLASRIDRESGRALGLARASRIAFELFGEKLPGYRGARWASVLPEVHLLEARSAIEAGDHAAAELALHSLAIALSGAALRRLGPPTAKLYRAELLLCLDAMAKAGAETGPWVGEELGVDPEDLTGAAVRLCEEVIEANFAHKKAWRVLIPLIPAERAAESIEEVLEGARERPQLEPTQQGALEWLEYQLAVLARQRADEMPGLLLNAFKSYVRLLVAQPANLPAAEELLEMHAGMQVHQEETASDLLDEMLVPMEDPRIPIAHAAIRWVLRGEVPDASKNIVDAHAIPLLGDGSASQSELGHAQAALERIVDGKNGRRLLESISKWVYERARASGDRERLTAVGRLLDPAIAADPNDPIWWSRRADVALTLRDSEKAEALLREIASSLRDDSIACFQIGRLLLMQGRFAEADEKFIDAECLDREQTGEANPYPAITDRRGFIALLESRYGEAEGHYRQILRNNEADPTAHYGLGRVYLQSPSHQLCETMRHWRISLRIRAADDSNPLSRRYAWRTAAGIAGVINQQVKTGESANGADALHEELAELLAIEDVAVGRRVVKALRVRGVTHRRAAEVAMGAEKSMLAQEVAQFLMARTIHLYIESPSSWSSFVDEDLPVYLDWCERRDVLGDFLAGAKGSYARAHIRAAIAGQPRHGMDEGGAAATISARKLKKLVDHVVETSYSASYYEDAYAFLRAAGRAKGDQLTGVVTRIIGRMAHKLQAEFELADRDNGGHSFLAALWPSVGLETVGGALGADNIDAALTAYVDLDALRYAKSVQKLNRWEVASTQLIGLAGEPIPPGDRRSYARAGIRWEVPDEENRQRCTIDLADFEANEAEALGGEEQVLALAQ